MRLLEERIQRDGIVKSGDVLKVDSFLNHQMDVALFEEMALEWKRAFDGKPINKILTIEASGIGIAAIVVYSMFLSYLQRRLRASILTERYMPRVFRASLMARSSMS